MVDVKSRGPRLELVREVPSGPDDLEDAVHVRRVDAVEVDRVRVGASVAEPNAKEVALGRADDRPRSRAVVRPGREEDPGADLEFRLGYGQHVLAYAPRPVPERLGRIEDMIEVVRPADGRRLLVNHRCVARRSVQVARRRPGWRAVFVSTRLRSPVESELAHERRGDKRRGRTEQPPTCQA